MEEFLYDIKNLKCTYNQHDVVLQIDDLQIPRGKLVVLLGVSGSGKSTFIETLGIMNNTIHSGEIRFYPQPDSPAIDIESLWKKENQSKASKIRNQHLSFIFQNTNLMPNFSAIENICISQLIQGLSLEEATKNAKEYMQQVRINGLEINRESIMFSGGERQRIAFVRAISPHFSVLFGDEPTGNLDEFNARELMHVIKNTICNSGRTAIIVSHNIQMAIEFADYIYILTRHSDESPGIIQNQHNIRKNESDKWYNNSGNEVKDVYTFISKTIKHNDVSLKHLKYDAHQ
jgi:lipoprotein-releasing system ATP-binding protein